MTQKQSWSRAANVCDKVVQSGKTGAEARKRMRALATTREMKKRYSKAHISKLTANTCKVMIRSDISKITKHHEKKMKEQWRKIPKKRRRPFKEWMKTNAHNNPVDQAFKEDLEYLFNSE